MSIEVNSRLDGPKWSEPWSSGSAIKADITVTVRSNPIVGLAEAGDMIAAVRKTGAGGLTGNSVTVQVTAPTVTIALSPSSSSVALGGTGTFALKASVTALAFGSALQYDPCPLVHEGAQVEVVHGPLRGVVGRLQRKDASRARLVLSVDLIGQAVSVEVDAAGAGVFDATCVSGRCGAGGVGRGAGAGLSGARR